MSKLDPQRFDEEYKDLIRFYFRIKELIAAAEREDGEQRISVSAIAELRSAFDHVMRAHNVLFGLISEDEIRQSTSLTPIDYCKKNFDKAYGHLYRAGYDAYDCISISLIDDIEKVMSGVSKEAFHTVINNATISVVTPFKKAKELFTTAKVNKDVESREQEEKQFLLYEEANEKLCDIRDFLNEHASDLFDYNSELKAKSKKGIFVTILISLLSVLLGVLLGFFL